MTPGDRLICAFVEPAQVGKRFINWPLHVTIVPWFRTPQTTDTVAQALAEQLKDQQSFEATLTDEEHFGHRGQKLVRLLREPTPLTNIEVKVRAWLHEQNAWIVDETTKIQRPFRPHVTNQNGVAARSGRSFTIDKIHIVEQLGSQKEVAGAVEFAL